MTETEVWTIGRLLTWTTDHLKKQGIDTPRLDAEVLLAEARGCQRIDLYAAYTDPASDEVRGKFRELVRRRCAGTPVAYLVGRREFYSLSFRVTPDVLIPRPETELLVITLLDLVKKLPAGQSVRVADVGTGSGIVAVCVARQAPQVHVTAIDISPAALEVAASNALAHGVESRVEFVHSDLFESVPRSEPFDYIASNPPYISTSEMAALAPEVRDAEPHLALCGGERGTDVVERLVPQAAERLAPGGYLFLEISPMIREAVEQIVAATPAFEPAIVRKDLAGLARVVQARKRME